MTKKKEQFNGENNSEQTVENRFKEKINQLQGQVNDLEQLLARYIELFGDLNDAVVPMTIELQTEAAQEIVSVELEEIILPRAEDAFSDKDKFNEKLASGLTEEILNELVITTQIPLHARTFFKNILTVIFQKGVNSYNDKITPYTALKYALDTVQKIEEIKFGDYATVNQSPNSETSHLVFSIVDYIEDTGFGLSYEHFNLLLMPYLAVNQSGDRELQPKKIKAKIYELLSNPQVINLTSIPKKYLTNT